MIDYVKQVIYLASPYSHVDPKVMQARHDEVARIYCDLISEYIVFCPILHNHTAANISGTLTGNWATWREQDLGLLSRCDILVVALMEGWHKSVGVQAEIKFARENLIPVQFYDPEAKQMVEEE